jgi:predicted PurR-regulated permease PerM
MPPTVSPTTASPTPSSTGLGPVPLLGSVSTAPKLSTLTVLVALVIIFALAKELLVPIALAGFISLLLHPLVVRLQRIGARRTVSVVVVSLVAAAPIVAVAWVVVQQAIAVATTLPQYRGNIRHKLESLQGPVGRLMSSLSELMEQVRPLTSPTAGTGPEPVGVKVVEPPPNPLSMLHEYGGTAAHPLATLSIVVVVVIFILMQWDDLRDRLVRLVSFGKLTAATNALDELESRIGRFLRAQFMVNVGVGIVVALALSIIGVPNAFLWGFLAAALRYVPYLGSLVAAALPLILTVATSEGWAKPIEVLVFFVVFEVINSNFVEPTLYGSTTGISAMALLVAAIFWGWLWGVPGLLLSTPLTVCLVVAGRHVPQLTFLSVLLGDQPSLEPSQKLYQRLLAMDTDDADDVAEAYLTDHTLVQLFDNLFIPILTTADREREIGILDADHQSFIYQAMRDMIEDCVQRAQVLTDKKIVGGNGVLGGPSPEATELLVRPVLATARPERLRILCVPANDEPDALVGLMIEVLAPSIEAGARALTLHDLGTDLTQIVKEFKPDVLVVSAVPPHASTHARARLAQIQRKVPGARVIAGLWSLNGTGQRARERMVAAGTEGAVSSVADMMRTLEAMRPHLDAAQGESGPSASGEPAPRRAY